MNSTSLKLAILAVVAASGVLLVLQRRSTERLSADNDELRRTVALLTEEARVARASMAGSAVELERERQDRAELLRLRADVGRLKAQLAAPKVPVRSGPDTAASPSPAQREEEVVEATKRFGIRRLNESKLLVLGMLQFAASHQDQFPQTLEAARAQLTPDSVEGAQTPILQDLRIEEFEPVFTGSLREITNPAATIVLRERSAWQTPSGRWARSYGFADGHSEIKSSEDGDYSAWEAERQAGVPGANPP